MKGGILMKNKNVFNLVFTSILLAVIIVVQILARNFNVVIPVLAGPFVNAVLIVAAYLCGGFYGSILAVLSPIFAAVTGQLAAPMVPFVPFIIVGNLLYVIPFALLKNKGKLGIYGGFILGSLLKFIFLTVASKKLIYVVGLNIPKKVALKLASAMSLPQLITAIIGGILAYLLIKLLKARKIV